MQRMRVFHINAFLLAYTFVPILSINWSKTVEKTETYNLIICTELYTDVNNITGLACSPSAGFVSSYGTFDK